MFTKLSLSNVIKNGECDVERQISIQGMHLSAFRNYFWKRDGCFNCDIILAAVRCSTSLRYHRVGCGDRSPSPLRPLS